MSQFDIEDFAPVMTATARAVQIKRNYRNINEEVCKIRSMVGLANALLGDIDDACKRLQISTYKPTESNDDRAK